MGLDMYLSKTKKVLSDSKNEVMLMSLANNWLSYLDDEETCSFEEYCGVSESVLEEIGGLDAVKNTAELVKPNLVMLAEWNIVTEDGEKKHVVYRSIWQEIGYWRKANHIHKWFVDKVQGGDDDCEYYKVTKDNLLNLKATCDKVLSLKGMDEEKIKEILPTESGFFFGSTAYDEYYFSDVEETIKIIIDVLKTTDFEKELVVYRSSW